MFRPGSTLTVNNAGAVLNAGLRSLDAGQEQIDLAELTAVDSAAVATLLAWQRAASQRGKQLVFVNPPANLQSLAELYGVADLLNTVSPVDHHAHLPHH